MENPEITKFNMLGVQVAATNMQSVIQAVHTWIKRGDRGRMVTFSNVHMLVEGTRDPEFLKLLQKSDLNCADGMPLVWYGRSKTGKKLQRVCGPEFLPAFCAASEGMNLRHFFYGGGDGVAVRAVEELQQLHPGMQIAGTYTPPFRPLTPEEDDEVVRIINASRPDVIWVSLGCPKQEIWIDEHRNRLDAPVLLAVGLAVDIMAGTKKRAPQVMRGMGLEWFYRLCQEPRRLWGRYLVYNSIFLYHLAIQLTSRLFLRERINL
jgi:N-acetylglucosaminyldiphosphoundecaprenol N-acetyl-beta-D-mannosaminyltransferase